MSNPALEPRSVSHTNRVSPAREAIGSRRDSLTRPPDAVMRRDFEESPLESAADFVRILIGVIAFYVVLFALPLLLLLPFAVMGLVLGTVALLFSGVA